MTMSRPVIYTTMTTLDGFTSTTDGGLDWAIPDRELHEFINAQEVGAEALYGRRMWEVMSGHWPTAADDPATEPHEAAYAEIWNAQEKVVFSSTLEAVEHGARLVRGDAAAEVRELRERPGGPLGVGGATLAGSLFAAGLIDELRLYVHPVALGAGAGRVFPSLDRRIQLAPKAARSFGSGVEYRSYRVEH